MLEPFDKIQEVARQENVQLGESFKDLINKELCLGMTRHVVRHGTLGPGFEKLTPAQRYYQCIREVYTYSDSIKTMAAKALEYKADLIDAEEEFKAAEKESEKLRAESKKLLAENNLINAYLSVQDNSRILDELVKIYKELQPIVREKYPEGIEQAEPDNWKTVAKYRYYRAQQKDAVDMMSIPLSQEELGKLGYEMQRLDLMAPLIVTDEEKMHKIKEEADRAKLLAGETSNG